MRLRGEDVRERVPLLDDARRPDEFRKIEVLPTDKERSRCEDCIAGRVHQQAACPQKGDKRPRENVPGQLQKATKNRIPPLLASVIGRALINGRVRSELREQLASRRVR